MLSAATSTGLVPMLSSHQIPHRRPNGPYSLRMLSLGAKFFSSWDLSCAPHPPSPLIQSSEERGSGPGTSLAALSPSCEHRCRALSIQHGIQPAQPQQEIPAGSHARGLSPLHTPGLWLARRKRLW